MDRSEYIIALRSYLGSKGMQPSDIEEAIGFYGDIIMEGSDEDFQRLGSVEKLGNEILAQSGIFVGGEGSYQMESAFVPGQESSTFAPPVDDAAAQAKRNSLLMIILIIVTFPIWIGFVMGILGTMFGICAALIALIALFTIGGGALAVEGIIQMFHIIPVGLTLCGAGLVMIGVCGLTFIPLFRLFIRFIVWVCKTVFGQLRRLTSGVSA
ncbi:MAG: hypothetical protein IJ571_05695 [Ruminococcus sp.]|nr:hypothetical protein [Ruminococcus sp.]